MRITSITIASGQPRPYADSRFIAHITFEHWSTNTQDEGGGSWLPTDISSWNANIQEQQERRFKEIVRKMHPWTEPQEAKYDWASTHLKHFKCIIPSEAKWELHLTNAFTD